MAGEASCGEKDEVERRTRASLFDLETRRLAEAVVSVTSGRLESWTDLPGLAPGLLTEERESMEAAIKVDSRWLTEVRRRGVSDPGRRRSCVRRRARALGRVRTDGGGRR